MKQRKADLENQAFQVNKLENAKDSLASRPEDAIGWEPTDNYDCEKCGSNDCLAMMTIGTARKEDQSGICQINFTDEPVITIRCKNCGNLWKYTTGETISG